MPWLFLGALSLSIGAGLLISKQLQKLKDKQKG